MANNDIVNLKNAKRMSESFYLAESTDKPKIIFSSDLSISIEIKDNGYIPKSGLILAEELRKLTVTGQVLDIGTGESGILANCLLALGASKVIATDIDPDAIQWAHQASNISHLIQWENCDLCNYPLNQRGSFDLIVSNPPQMPMEYPGHSHDDGGLDGRDTILRIIERAPDLLRPNGKLIILCFDFLGIEKSLNCQPSISAISKKMGLKMKVLSRHRRSIRKGGKTEESLPWIQKVYPQYLFSKNDGNIFYEILVIEICR